jgi:hypothetical protein
MKAAGREMRNEKQKNEKIKNQIPPIPVQINTKVSRYLLYK